MPATPAQKVAAAIMSYVRHYPGSTCFAIAAGIGERTWYVSGELRALRAAGKLTSTGNTRGTKWTAVTRARQ